MYRYTMCCVPYHTRQLAALFPINEVLVIKGHVGVEAYDTHPQEFNEQLAGNTRTLFFNSRSSCFKALSW